MKQTSTIRILAAIALLAMSSLTVNAQQWGVIDLLPTPRGFTTAQEINGKIYVIGGALTQSQSTSIVEVFDPFATDGSRWDTVASFPVPICAAASVVVSDKIYVFGGKPTHNSPLWYDSVYEFDPASGPEGAWTLVDTMPLGPRAFLTACAVDTLVYVIGGRTPSLFSIRRVERYNTTTGDWETLPDLITDRSNLITGQLHGAVYAIGGVNANPICCDTEEFDGTQWTVATTDDGTPVVINSWWGGGVTFGGNLYVVGGILTGTGSPLYETRKFNPHNGVSSFASEPGVKAAFGIAIMPDPETQDTQCIYAIGGILEPFFYPSLPGPAVDNTVWELCDTLSGVKDLAVSNVLLSQNIPNPFTAQTTITFELKNAADVSLQVFDLSGRVVATLFDGRRAAGEYSVAWDAAGMQAGVYCYRLQTNGGVWTRKCILQNH
ncbi:MAG: T9SS type A sorting domain-containing protein [Saprospirales bacterium]|nr:T9SS type A sorting domain-containing protein [Saprospirales bacterium]